MVGKTTLTRLGAAGLALLTMTLPLAGQTAVPPAVPEKQRLVVEVRVPTDALLEVDGTRTQSTGPIRTFRSPPVPVGKSYTYTLTARWRGETVTRPVRVRTDRRNTVDLRKELETAAAPQPAASFTLAKPPRLTLKGGEEGTLTFTIRRDNFKEPVAVEVLGLPRHLRVNAPGKIPGDQDNWQAVVTAAKEAQPGTTTVTVRARGAKVDREVAFQVTVEKAPPPPAILSLEVPPALRLQPGDRKAVRVRVSRENFTGPVTVTFAGLPEGVTVEDVTIAEGKSEAEVQATAAITAGQGTTEVQVVGTGGEARAAVKLKVTVKAAPPRPEMKPTPKPEAGRERKAEVTLTPRPGANTEPRPGPKPESSPAPAVVEAKLQLDVEDVVLQPGEVRYAEVRVKPRGSTSFDSGPEIRLEGPVDNKVGCALWSVSSKADPASHIRGYAVGAAPDATEGDRQVKLLVTAGAVRAEGTLKITVKKLPPKPQAEAKPEPLPAFTLELGLPEVTLQPGEAKCAEVTVRPTGAGSFAGDPDVKLQGPADDKVQLTLWSVSSKTDPTTHSRVYAVRAAPDAAEGDRQVKVLATAGAVRAEGTLKITVKKVDSREAAAKPESKP